MSLKSFHGEEKEPYILYSRYYGCDGLAMQGGRAATVMGWTKWFRNILVSAPVGRLKKRVWALKSKSS